MNADHILALGMTRALGLMEDCDGDLDFAICAVKKDIEALKQAGDGRMSETESVDEVRFAIQHDWGGRRGEFVFNIDSAAHGRQVLKKLQAREPKTLFRLVRISTSTTIEVLDQNSQPKETEG